MKKKIIYSRRLGREVASLAHPDVRVKFHVLSGISNWRVVMEGSVKALRTFSTEDQAVNFARERAFEKTGEVVVHGDSGIIRNRISFDPKK